MFPRKRHQMRHLCDLACLLAKQVLSQLSYTPTAGTTHSKAFLPFPKSIPSHFHDCVFTVQKPYVFELSGLTSSEKQIPRNC